MVATEKYSVVYYVHHQTYSYPVEIRYVSVPSDLKDKFIPYIEKTYGIPKDDIVYILKDHVEFKKEL